MINISRHSTRLLAALTLLSGAAPGAANAQVSLPDGRTVLKRFADVSGAAKLAAVPGVHLKGVFELPSQGLTGVLESFSDKNGRTVQMTTITGIGQIQEGSDSALTWTLDPVQGPRILKGKEADERRELVDPRGMRRDPAFVVDVKTLVRTVIDGEQCFQLDLTWKSGRHTKECYSEKTGLLVSMDAIETTSMGDIPVSRSYSDYKTFDGVTLATKVIERTQGLEATQRITEVTFEAIDEIRFALPPQIKALRGG